MSENLINNVDINNLSADELLKVLYGKELNSKKTILEYIELTKILKKENVEPNKIQETYNLIYDSIENMKNIVKPNTTMYLKNKLKAQLGKLVKDKDPKEESTFIKFFKEAYPSKERGKSFTWVLMDINNITGDQIWNTLTYINRECLTNNLKISKEEKKDIIEMIKKLLSKKDIKYINRVKSLEKILNVLNIKIVDTKKGFKVENR